MKTAKEHEKTRVPTHIFFSWYHSVVFGFSASFMLPEQKVNDHPLFLIREKIHMPSTPTVFILKQIGAITALFICYIPVIGLVFIVLKPYRTRIEPEEVSRTRRGG